MLFISAGVLALDGLAHAWRAQWLDVAVALVLAAFFAYSGMRSRKGSNTDA
jgi:hypothetical protein